MASKYIQKFPIPEGFNDILHDLAKEVLRYQPEDIIEFCASYFKCLQEGKELDYSRKGTNIPCDFKNVIPGIRSDTERTKPIDKSNLETAAFKANSIGKLNNNDKEDHNKENKEIKKDDGKVNHKEDHAKVSDNDRNKANIVNDHLEDDDIKAGTLELDNKNQERLATKEGGDGDDDEELEYQNNNKRQISITTEEAKKLSRDFTSDLFKKDYNEDV